MLMSRRYRAAKYERPCKRIYVSNLGLVGVVSRYLRSDSLENLSECHLCPQDLAIDDQSIVVEGHVLDHGLSIHLPEDTI